MGPPGHASPVPIFWPGGSAGRTPQLCVMHGGNHARKHLNCFEEVLLLLQLGGKVLIDGEVGKLALGRNVERVGHLNDEVGGPPRWMRPAVLELRQPGCQRRVTFRRASIRPGHDCVDLLARQPAVVAELAISGIRAPRWHFPSQDLVFDRPRPRPHLSVGHQGHRGHLVWPMAGHALAEHNRRDILVERRRNASGALGGRADTSGDGESEQRCGEDQGGDSHIGLPC